MQQSRRELLAALLARTASGCREGAEQRATLSAASRKRDVGNEARMGQRSSERQVVSVRAPAKQFASEPELLVVGHIGRSLA